MPYRSSGRLQDMMSVGAVESSVEMAARDGLAFAETAIKDRTPVYVGWPRPGRDSGRLRRSVRKTRFVRRISAFAVLWEAGVETDDPVGPHVEWDTKPHPIEPRADRADASVLETGKARGTVKDGRAALAWRGPMGGLIFAGKVNHPGTKGQHMFALGAVETERRVGRWSARATIYLQQTMTRGEKRP